MAERRPGRAARAARVERGEEAELATDRLRALVQADDRTSATAAAEAVADSLGRPLLRVDLARVISRYIGETEKNLDALFRKAAAAGAVLFFDEADALFGKRTEVKDSHDRYAGARAVLDAVLDRLDAHPGPVLVASEHPDDLDERLAERLRDRGTPPGTDRS